MISRWQAPVTFAELEAESLKEPFSERLRARISGFRLKPPASPDIVYYASFRDDASVATLLFATAIDAAH